MLVIDGWGVSSEISLRLISLDFIDVKSTLVKVMAWCHKAQMLTHIYVAIWHHYATMS